MVTYRNTWGHIKTWGNRDTEGHMVIYRGIEDRGY